MNSPYRRLYLLAPPLLAVVTVLLLLLGLGGTTQVAEANGLANRCFATPDDGTTVYASSTFTAVQAAVDDLGAAGGTVRVAGTCAGVQVRDGLTQTVYISAPLTLRGGYTTTDWVISNPVDHPTVLDAEGGGRVISATYALTIENLTIQNGSSTASQGGGVRAGGATVVANSLFVNNKTMSAGGGLYTPSTLAVIGTRFLSNTSVFIGGGALAGGAVTVVNSLFANNECTNNAGGGLYATTTLAMTGTHILSNRADSVGGGVAVNDAATIANSRFEHNESTSHGGGLVAGSTLTMTGAFFLGNTANGRGGGLSVSGAATIANSRFEHNESTSASRGGGALYAFSTLTITETHFLSNTAKDQGGGVVVDGAATVTNSRFQNNRSLTDLGGGLYAKDVLSLTNSLLVSNTALHGGAIYASGGGLKLTNSTLAANHAISSGGGISTTGLLTIANSILWANTPDQAAASGAVSATRSIIEDGDLGGINEDPLFVRNPDRAAGDLGNLHLRQDSPGIDAGDDSFVPAGIITDLDGLSRLFDVSAIANNGANIVDMGAYELNSQLILPIADAGGPYTRDEGSPVDLDGSGSNSAHALLGYGWDCTDDGTFDVVSSQPTGDSCTYADNGSFTLRLVVTDTGGLTDTDTATVTVDNVAPIVTPPSNQTATAGTQKAFDLGSFSDPGDDSPWTVSVKWGDGITDTLPDAASPGNLPDQSHTYAANGTYTVMLSVNDGEESGSATFQVLVSASGGTKLYLPTLVR